MLHIPHDVLKLNAVPTYLIYWILSYIISHFLGLFIIYHPSKIVYYFWHVHTISYINIVYVIY